MPSLASAILARSYEGQLTLVLTIVDENNFDLMYFVPKQPLWTCDPKTVQLQDLPITFIRLNNPDFEFDATSAMRKKILDDIKT